ncbi:MAG: ABC transporter ATP-binding protein, partial [Anaerolineales bacterium]
LNISVAAGEIFGFLGPNGAGKTTTIRMLTGQLRPTAGSATIFGYDIVEERAAIKPLIGVVFEVQNLYERESARGNLRFYARLYGIEPQQVDVVLRQVGLEEAGKKPVKTFSNGMKQRLLIGRALLHQPRLLFLDEPTRGLDPHLARAIRAEVRALADSGLTVFLTTHYMEEADQLCDRVAILDRGSIAALDTPENLKRQSSRDGQATLEDVFIELTGRDFYQPESMA